MSPWAGFVTGLVGTMEYVATAAAQAEIYGAIDVGDIDPEARAHR